MTKIPFFFGMGGVMGSGEQYFPWIHIADAVGVYAHAAMNPPGGFAVPC